MTRQWNKTTKKKLYLLVALGLALILSSGAFAYTYVTSVATIGVTPPTAELATCNATASQPNWSSVLVPAETTNTEILNPNAVGDETEIQSQIGSGSHWQLVDDWPTHDGDSTVVYTGNAGWEEDLYNLPSHSATSGNVTYVKVYIVCRSTAAPTQTNAYVHIKTGGVEHNDTPVTTGTGYSAFSYQWDENPNTGDPWTWDEIDALQIGVALREAGGGALTGCTQVYAEIGYGDITSTGEVPAGNLFIIQPNPGYVGDMQVGIHLLNTGSLVKAYQYLNMQVYMEGSVSANQTPNYRLLTLQNGQTTLSLESLAGISGSFYQTNKSDFDSGNLTNLDTATSVGDVILDAFAGNVTDNFTDQSMVESSANVTFSNNQVKLLAGGAAATETLRPNAAGDNTSIAYEYPAWYDSSWSRRVPVTVNNTGSALTDYQVSVNVTYDADMQPDFEDIRFTDTDGSTPLSHWIESYIASTSATFWVQVPSVPSGTKTIYMYYGNVTASSASDGDATFEFFDDFEDGDISDWTNYSSGVVQIADDSGNYVLLKTTNNDPNGGYSLFNNGSLSDYEAVFRTKRINENGGSQNRYGIEDGSFNGYGPRMYDFNSLPSNFAIERRTGGSSTNLVSKSTSAYEWDTWMTVKFRKYGSNLEFELYNSSGSLAESINTTDTSYNSFDRFVVHGGWEFYTDDIWIRKYVSTEPTTSLGTEESQGGHWDKVDDVTSDNYSTYVSTNSTSYQRDLYSIPDHSSGSGAVDNVTVYFRFARNAGTSNAYARAAIKTGGTVYTGTEESTTSSTFSLESYHWTNNPSTNTTWTWSEVDALQAGIELRGGDAATTAACTQLYVEVSYTPYNSPGTLTSTNLLSGETAASIDNFSYNASAIPSGTGLQVQYSSDNSSWYNSLGVPDAWDTMSQGTGNISLANLDWSGSNFYYNMQFTSDGPDTPILDMIDVAFSTHYTSGNLTSSTYDTGDDQDWNWEFIYFTINEPTNTDIKFQIRSAATEGGLSSATWYGPTGTGDYYTTSITEINPVHDGDRWIQYRADFSSLGDATPTLSDIELTYTLASVTYTVEIIGGSYGLVSSNMSDWSPGWTITPEFYCEVTQR